MHYYLDYLLNNGSCYSKEIAAPNEKYDDYKKPLVKALEHEQFVTASINTI